VTLVLKALGSDQALNMGGLGVRLLALALGLDLAANDVLANLFAEELKISLGFYTQTLPALADENRRSSWAGEDGIAVARSTYIVFLAEAEEAADLGGTLGTEAFGLDGIGEAGDILLALLDDREGKDRQVGANDAAADRLALALAGATGAVAGVAVGEEEADTGGGDNTLLHWETLLVVAASDADDITLPLIAKGLGRNLGAHLFPSAPLRSGFGRSLWTYSLPIETVSWISPEAMRLEKPTRRSGGACAHLRCRSASGCHWPGTRCSAIVRSVVRVLPSRTRDREDLGHREKH